MTLQKKYALEVGVEISLVLFYIWVVERYFPGNIRPLFLWGLCVGFPIYCVAKHQRAFPEFSLDWQHFLRSLPLLSVFTLVGTLVLCGVALATGQLNYDGIFLQRVSEYIFWGFLQQIGFQTFLTYRVGRVVTNHHIAALASSALFSFLHFPNPALMVFTWVGGYFWALSYLKTPNLYLLAVSHGWLAVVALQSVPSSWLHGLRVGPTYWTY